MQLWPGGIRHFPRALPALHPHRPDFPHRNRHLQRLELFHRFPAHRIQQRSRSERSPLTLQRNLGQFISRPAQTPQLLPQRFHRKGPIPRGAENRPRTHRHRDLRPPGQPPLHDQRRTFPRRHLHRNRLPTHRAHRFHKGFHQPGQRRILRAPHQIPRPDPPEPHRPVPEPQFRIPPAPRDRHLINPAALFRLPRTPPVRRVEHYPIARSQRQHRMRLGRSHRDRIEIHADHPPHQHAPMPRRPPVHHGLMIRPRREMRPQPARVHLLQPQFVFPPDLRRLPRPGLIHRLPVGTGGERHVIGILITPLDLQRAHPGPDYLRNLPQCIQIPRRQKVPRIRQRLPLAIHHQVIRKPAGLRALPPVRTPPAPRL